MWWKVLWPSSGVWAWMRRDGYFGTRFSCTSQSDGRKDGAKTTGSLDQARRNAVLLLLLYISIVAPGARMFGRFSLPCLCTSGRNLRAEKMFSSGIVKARKLAKASPSVALSLLPLHGFSSYPTLRSQLSKEALSAVPNSAGFPHQGAGMLFFGCELSEARSPHPMFFKRQNQA